MGQTPGGGGGGVQWSGPAGGGISLPGQDRGYPRSGGYPGRVPPGSGWGGYPARGSTCGQDGGGTQLGQSEVGCTVHIYGGTVCPLRVTQEDFLVIYKRLVIDSSAPPLTRTCPKLGRYNN